MPGRKKRRTLTPRRKYFGLVIHDRQRTIGFPAAPAKSSVISDSHIVAALPEASKATRCFGVRSRAATPDQIIADSTGPRCSFAGWRRVCGGHDGTGVNPSLAVKHQWHGSIPGQCRLNGANHEEPAGPDRGIRSGYGMAFNQAYSPNNPGIGRWLQPRPTPAPLLLPSPASPSAAPMPRASATSGIRQPNPP